MKTLQELASRLAEGEACALATVVETVGSTPGERAAKMVVGAEGRVAGTIGGGHVEAQVEQRAKETLRSGKPAVLSFTLDDDLADQGGLICGGTVKVLVERVAPPAPWAAAAAEIATHARRGALLARIGEDRVERELVEGEPAEEYLRSEDARIEGDVFVEPLFTPRCIILGAGHVGRRVARIAREASFVVAVVEDREDQARRAEADEVVCADLVEGFERLDPGPDDYVVIMTRGHRIDLQCARAALRSPAKYVGMLASRKKAATIGAALEREGLDPKRLHAPIGLDLAAKSAGEIAVSVVAQCIKVRRLGRGDR